MSQYLYIHLEYDWMQNDANKQLQDTGIQQVGWVLATDTNYWRNNELFHPQKTQDIHHIRQ